MQSLPRRQNGGRRGPDLSSIEFSYNRLQLIEEVLNPSKNILDGYESFAVEWPLASLDGNRAR
jgi:hypothetical protein